MVDIENIFRRIENMKVLIIGDVMVDEYIYGDVNRISPEAPVPILDFDHKEYRLGGAANVALNIKSLGATPYILSCVGKKSEKFINILKEKDIKYDLVNSETRNTTYKIRLMSNSKQMMRIDYETLEDLNSVENEKILELMDSILSKNNIDIVILSDYDKGVLNKANISKIIDRCKDDNIPIVVDPKFNNFLEYKDVDIFKPNIKEYMNGFNIKDKKFDIKTNINILKNLTSCKNAMITMSEKGIYYNDQHNNSYMDHDVVKNVADVSGAGDTVTATTALLYVLGVDPSTIIKICNIAGGLVCEELGVVQVDKNKIIEKYLNI